MKNRKSSWLIWSFLFVGISIAMSCASETAGDRRTEDQQFVTEAASSNSLEIAAGNLAITKGNSEQVREFGRQMVDEHTKVGQELTDLASNKQLSVSTEMIDKHRNQLERLQDKEGADFDEEFIKLMIDSHEEAVDLFADAAEGGNGVVDEDLRKFAEAKLPNLRRHLEHAERLKSEVDSANNNNNMLTDSLFN